MQSVQNYFKKVLEGFMTWVSDNPRRAAIWGGAILLFIIGLFLPKTPPHVALSGEQVFINGPAWLTNSILTTVVVDILIVVLALLATTGMKLVPTGWQNFMEMVVEYLYGLAESVAGANARKFFPWVTTVFLFVIISNWSGLIPGVGSFGVWHPYHDKEGEHALVLSEKLAMVDGTLVWTQPENQEIAGEAAPAAAAEGDKKFIPMFRAPSADLNTTFALGLTIVFMVQVWGVQALGGSYFKKFFNFSGTGFMKGINIFVGLLELISEFSRILAFGFRLFGNIFAGEIILFTMAFLVPLFLPIPFYILEIFVGFVQALVFFMLALVFFSMSVISHGDHHDDHGHAEHGHGAAAAH